jgi:NTE family protein
MLSSVKHAHTQPRRVAAPVPRCRTRLRVSRLMLFSALALVLLAGGRILAARPSHCAGGHAVSMPNDSVRVLRLPVSPASSAPFSDHRFPALARPRLGLALSGGGARGIAQVGVLLALDEAGIRPDFIVGTSIGSIVGGLYAAGYSAERLRTVVRTMKWQELLRLTDQADRRDLFVDQKPANDRSIFSVRFEGVQPVLPQSVSNGQRLTNTLNELALQAVYHSRSFDHLRIPFRAVATDLLSGRRVVLDGGSLAEAMRASATVPVMYAAVQRDSMLLVDGGLKANLPVDVARAEGCDVVLAVNTSSPLRNADAITNPLETLDQVLSVMIAEKLDAQLALADVVVTPDIGSFSATDFSPIDTLIARGYAAGLRALPALRERMMGLALTRLGLDSVDARQFFLRHDPDPDLDVDPWFAAPHSIRECAWKAVGLYRSDRYDSIALAVTGDTGRFVLAPRPRIGRVRVHQDGSGADNSTSLGALIPPDDAPSRLLDSAAVVAEHWQGAPLSSASVRRLCEDLTGIYRAGGYSLATVTGTAIDSVTRDIRVTVSLGRIGTIAVTGNTRTQDMVILREFPLREGTLFRIGDMKRGLQNIAALNLFHAVSFDVDSLAGQPRVTVRVVERPSQMLNVGLLVDNERNAQASIELKDANLFGWGSEIAAVFFGGARNQYAGLHYGSNRIFYTPFNLRLQGYASDVEYNQYSDVQGLDAGSYSRTVVSQLDIARLGAMATLGVYVQRFGNLYGLLRYERQHVRTHAVSDPSITPVDDWQNLFCLGVGTTLDTRDRWPYPVSGLSLTVDYQSAQNALGGDVAFSRLHALYDVYFSVVADALVLRPRIDFGYADRTLPESELFRLGGQHSFYGMRENEFTGRQLLTGSLEARWRLPVDILFDTYLSVRYDIGKAWETPEKILLKDLRHGAGIGLGLDTPIGPADFAIGRSFYFSEGDPVLWTGPLDLYFSIGVGLP